MDVQITIGKYIIRPESDRPDGRVILEIMRVEDQDRHDRPVGKVIFVDVDELFKE